MKIRQGNLRDLVGEEFGRLRVVQQSGRSTDGHVMWRCVCVCGSRVEVQSNSLVRSSGGTRSCGCLRREVSSRRSSWNAGRTYAIPTTDGTERVYRHRHSWAKAVIRERGNRCERCGWNRARCDVHHRILRCRRGLNTISNAIVLCPNCHRETHEAGK